MINYWLEIVKAVSEIVTALGIFVFLYQAFLQYRQSKYTALSELHKDVVRSSIREGLQFIYNRNKEDITFPMNKEERDKIEQVLDIYDLIGFRVKKRLLPKDATLETEWKTVWRVWYQMEAYVKVVNDGPGGPYKQHLGWLRNEAEKYRKSNTHNKPKIMLEFCQPTTAYAKPCVAVLIEKDNRVLIAKRAIEPAKGKWDILGGFIEPGESAEKAAVREVLEETGLLIRLTKYLGSIPDVYGKSDSYTVNFCFVAQIVHGTEQPQSDVAALEWIVPPQFPKPEDMAFVHQSEVIKMYLNFKKGIINMPITLKKNSVDLSDPKCNPLKSEIEDEIRNIKTMLEEEHGQLIPHIQ